MDGSPARDLGLAAVPFATLDQVLAAQDARVIDLRSPSEFADDHLPGAVNVPLFDDQERAMVGLLYKQFSPDAALQEGRAIVAGKVEAFVGAVAEHAGWEPRETDGGDLKSRVLAMTEVGIGRLDVELTSVPVERVPPNSIILHCWRGGLRSRSVIALIRALGLERAIGLEGGYRSWRQRVMTGLADWSGVSRTVSLRGLTGVGKTLVLRELEGQRPGATLDLEGIAGHRSSLLGMVGLEPVSQKSFEAGVFVRLREGFTGDVMVVEGESRKVGDAVVPGPVWDAMCGAQNLLLEATVERRIEVLSEDYLAREGARAKLREQLSAVAARMPGRPDLPGMLDRDEIGPLVEIVLRDYYDPLYLRSESGKDYAARIDATDPSTAATAILDWIDSHPALDSDHADRAP